MLFCVNMTIKEVMGFNEDCPDLKTRISKYGITNVVNTVLLMPVNTGLLQLYLI